MNINLCHYSENHETQKITYMLMLKRLALTGFFAVIPYVVSAEQVESTGRYSYGPTVSERKACDMAEEKAKKEALNIAASEVISGHQILRCKETADNEKCLIHTSTWSDVTGLIRAVKRLSKNIINPDKEFKTCEIRISADVGTYRGSKDPGFDFSVSLNSPDNTFREGEKIEFTISPTKKMFITIFLWDPYAENSSLVSKIFPNEYDKDNGFDGKAVVPTSSSSQKYKFEATFSNKTSGKNIYIDQYASVVGTRKKIPFKDSYTVESLNGRLLELPAREWRQQRLGFYVLKGRKQ